MKQLIIIAVSLLSFNITAGAGSVDNCMYRHIIKAKHSFQSIVINNDIDVVLTECPDAEIYVAGDKKDIAAVSYFVKKGILYIQSKSGSLKGKVTVHVPVSHLQLVEINGNSTVTSNGTLSSRLLKVVVNGEAKFDIRSFGKILVEADESIDVNFEEQNKQHVLPLHIDSASLHEADLQMDAMLRKNI
ncbi:DUF2807 domain-containing protein [Lacibacter sp. MH-610]|uniref:GIN domain-containing protein n=1 Tax=Lacibacter sp. MH-610 TaxID=3020883 RepID=UPI0038912BEA